MTFHIMIQIAEYFKYLLFKLLAKLLHIQLENFILINDRISICFKNTIHTAVCSKLNNRKHNLTKYQYSIV